MAGLAKTVETADSFLHHKKMEEEQLHAPILNTYTQSGESIILNCIAESDEHK